jgi:hypothetical protein
VSDHDKRLRAELAAELGYIPASLDPDDIERHRRLKAAIEKAPTREQLAVRYRHFGEEHRRCYVEERGRHVVADQFDDGLPQWVPTKSVLPEPSVG